MFATNLYSIVAFKLLSNRNLGLDPLCPVIDKLFVRAFVDRVNDAIECVVKLDFPHLVVQRDLQLDQVLTHVLS